MYLITLHDSRNPKKGKNGIQMSELYMSSVIGIAMVCLWLLIVVGLKSSFILKNSFC